mgnify:FL=1
MDKEVRILENFLLDLNKEQYDAETNIDGTHLILAGAGTGKTKMLVSRTAYMLSKGIEPQNILLLTFTNKAAGEMRERIGKMVGKEKASKITACTFHSFCAKFLGMNYELAGFPKRPNIIDDSDATEIMKLVISDTVKKLTDAGKIVENFPDEKTQIDVNSWSINNMRSLEDAVKQKEKCYGYEKESIQVIRAFMDYKYQHNMVDYDDLLYYTVVALHRNEGARRSMDKHYQYIMCDEYQDTNIIQDDLLNLISRDYPNLAVVGDENQSIYRFRGAIVENILTFVKRHPGCKTTMLVQNYRSTQEILNVSNAVMGHAMEGVQKILRGQKNGEVPDFMVEENAMKSDRSHVVL